MAGRGVGKLLHRGAVEVFEPLAGEHGADGPFRDAFAGPQKVGTVGGAQRVVGIVGGEEDAVTRAGERADLAHDLALVAEVEVCGRLVEHDELRLLRKRARQQHELALAARDHRIGPQRKMRDTELVEHPRRHHPVARRWPAEEIAVRGAAHQHDAVDGEGEGRHMHLRHIGDEPCTLTNGNGRERASADRHVAGAGRENAEQGLEQRGLAAPVRAKQRQDLALLQRDVEAATNHAIAVADGEIAAGKAHDQVRCIPASSQMKNGVPMTAVRIPSGISTGAAVRASVSMKRRYPPPSSAAVGMSRGKSGPTRARARCGTTSPTQPMMPEVATLAEVTSVAAATMAMRSGPVASPSARASSSGSDITLSRQRSATSTTVPSATGPVSGSRSATVVAARLPSSQNVIAGSWL